MTKLSIGGLTLDGRIKLTTLWFTKTNEEKIWLIQDSERFVMGDADIN